jgi:hypothetical protein
MSRTSYRLFLDLDGVLANFDQGIYQITGCYPNQLTVSNLWQAAVKSDGFFEHLPWMPEGKKLWEATKKFNPTILTGLPRGQWAEPQKRTWCARELGYDVPVITCMAKDKIKFAHAILESAEIPILVDDRPKYRELWEAKGGIFIVHKSVSESLRRLSQLGFEVTENVDKDGTPEQENI